MKLPFAVAAFLVLASSASGESFTLKVAEVTVVEIAGATAAYTTNPAIADVTTTSPGRISVKGHSAGTTQLVVVTAWGTQSYLIKVAAAELPSEATRPVAGQARATWDGRYSSATEQVHNSVDVTAGNDARRSEFHVLHIQDLDPESDRPVGTIASIFYRLRTPRRELVLLDDLVDLSRMTILSTQVRGLHLLQGPLEVHAGYASSVMVDDFYLPAERRWVAGAGYSFDSGETRWTPSVYSFFSEPPGTTARRGVVGALAMERTRGDDFFLRLDAGVSRSIAAAAELRQNSRRGHFRARLSIKPDDFPTLGLSELPGRHFEFDSSRIATERLTFTSYGTFDQFQLLARDQEIGTGSAGLRYALTPRLALLGGVDASLVDSPSTSIRTVAFPFGLTWETPDFGAAASYRVVETSGTSRRGDTLRVSGHASRGGFSSSIWAERQRQAPTLELIFREEPDLELALLRLGITVRTPEDLARALRDNAALIDLGFITGFNVDLTPRRLRAGFNLGWSGTGRGRDRLRLLAVAGRDERIGETRDSAIASLTYSRRIFASTDLFGSYSWFRSGTGSQQETGTSFDAGIRQQFAGMPRFLQRSGTIEGFAFLDPAMSGTRDAQTSPLPDLVITLDDRQTTRTGPDGAYAFRDVSPGPHRVVAQLPPGPRAFFTTPSNVEASVPGHADFGLVFAAARIDGKVISDAAEGIRGAVVVATATGGTPLSATTDAAGHFVFAVPAGEFRVALRGDSLPPGYVIAGVSEHDVSVSADQPQSLAFEVKAVRSVAGRALPSSEVRIDALDRTTQTDAAGNFVFRSMPAGTFTITATHGREQSSTIVTLDPGPVTLRDVLLTTSVASGEASSAAASPQVRPTIDEASRSVPASPTTRFRVQVGAYRLASNVKAAVRSIERAGGQARTSQIGTLTIVSVGPFATRAAAEAEATRLEAAGMDAVVLSDVPRPRIARDQQRGAWVVQAGAYREVQNARELVRKLQRRGERVFTAATKKLTFVYVGPYAARQEADIAQSRIAQAGFEAFVTRR